MKNYYKSQIGDNIYFLESTPIDTINTNEFVRAFNKFGVLLDEYTLNGIREFCIEGFTEKRVSNAPVVNDADQMVFFAYDEDFNSPVGLAICFDKKFYSIPFSKGKRSESELYNIFESKMVDEAH